MVTKVSKFKIDVPWKHVAKAWLQWLPKAQGLKKWKCGTTISITWVTKVTQGYKLMFLGIVLLNHSYNGYQKHKHF